MQHLLVGESQENGRAERAVITFEVLLRVRKLSLECRIDFVTTVINQHLVGKDGRTAYERMKHKLHRGECCH